MVFFLTTLVSSVTWTTEKQREFFDRFAKLRGFHPTEEYEMWQYVRRDDIVKYKVCLSIHTYTHTHIRAYIGANKA